MDPIYQLAGNAKHVAIGSDLDGWYGSGPCPAGLDTILEQRVYSAASAAS